MSEKRMRDPRKPKSTKARQRIKRGPQSKARKESLTSEKWSTQEGALKELLEELNISPEDVKAMRNFKALTGEDRVRAARRNIEDSVINATEKPDAGFALSLSESQSLLSGYATLVNRIVRRSRAS